MNKYHFINTFPYKNLIFTFKKMKLSNPIQGCMTWGKWGKQFSKHAYQQQIDACLTNGVTSFDHADIYGSYSTEAEFGEAFSEMEIERNQIQLISKCGIQLEGLPRNPVVKHYQYDASYIIQSVEQSLQHLQTDYLDLFLLHRPSPLMQVDEIKEAIAQLKQQGKILAFGVSNFSIMEMQLLMKDLQVSCNQIEISLLQSETLTNGLLTFMQLHRIQPLAWSPLGSYFNSTYAQLQETVRHLSDKYCCNEAQILLAWLLKHPTKIIPVVGTTQVERMIKASEANLVHLDEVDWFLLWEKARGKQVA